MQSSPDEFTASQVNTKKVHLLDEPERCYMPNSVWEYQTFARTDEFDDKEALIQSMKDRLKERLGDAFVPA